ncbi:PAS domain-containing protein [Shiella aurantiaca]|nr:PAS domain-containing protein [Shiella aurantiaca]
MAHSFPQPSDFRIPDPSEAPTGLLVLNAKNGLILYVNAAMQQWAGLDSHQLQHLSFDSLFRKKISEEGEVWTLQLEHETQEVHLAFHDFVWEGAPLAQLIIVSPAHSLSQNTFEPIPVDYTGLDYFDRLLEKASSLFGADYAYVGSYLEQEFSIQSLSMYVQQQKSENIRYKLSNTPCEILLSSSSCIYSKNVFDKFPNDLLLREMEIEAYAGFPIYDSENQTIGVMIFLFKSPKEDWQFLKEVAAQVEKRLSRELEHYLLQQKQSERQERLSFAIQAVNFSVFEWDLKNNRPIFAENLNKQIGFPEGAFEIEPAIWHSFIHPSDKEAFRQYMNNLLEQPGNSRSIRYRIRKRKGEYQWIETTAELVETPNGEQASRVIGINKNIQDQIDKEEILRESEERFRALAENILGVVYMCAYDDNLSTLYVSDTITTFSGMDKSAYVQEKLSVFDILSPDDKAEQMKAIWALNKNNNTFICQYQVKDIEGNVRWMESRGTLLFSNEGSPLHIVGTLLDISYQKTTEVELEKGKTELGSQLRLLQNLHNQLKQSELRWSYALEGNGDGVWDWDIRKNEIFLTQSTYSLLGYPNKRGQRSTSIVRDLVHPDYYPQFIDAIKESKRPPFKGFFLELPLLRPDKNYKWVLIRGKVVEIAKNGRAKRMVGSVIDITKSRLQKRELTIYEEMVKQNSSAILFTDIGGYIEYTNTATLDLFNYQLHELVQKPFDYLSKNNSFNTQQLIKSIQSTGKYVGEHIFYTKLNQPIPCQINASLLFHEQQDILGLVITLTNIGHIKRLENDILKLRNEKLEQELFYQQQQTEISIKVQEQEKEKLARELHDGIGQMISLTKMQLSGLLDELPQDMVGSAQQIYSLLEQTTHDVKNITHDLMPLSIKQIGLDSALHILLKRYQDGAFKHKTQFNTEIDMGDFKPTEKQAIHLYRIAQELVNNSMKYAEATQLDFVLKSFKNTLHMVIEDNGKGFDYHEKMKLINSFGLKTVQERAKLINAKLTLDSEPGKGTAINLSMNY